MSLMRRLVILALAGLLALAALAAPASAAPITCPGGLTVTHGSNGTWYCAANHGNDTGAGWHQGNGNKL